MPESKVRKEAELKKKAKAGKKETGQKQEAVKLARGSRDWVPWVFVPVGLLGVAWMVVYNLASQYIGFMQSLGGWNVLIGMGLIVASFALMTLWK